MPVAMFANDFVVDVLHRRSQFILAVGALSVERRDDDRGCIVEWLSAVFALHFHLAVLRVNSKFFTTARALDVMSFW